MRHCVLLGIAALPLSAAVTVDGARATFSSARMIATVENGSVVRLVNRLTGSEFIAGRGSPEDAEFRSGLVRAVPGLSAAGEQATIVGPAPVGAGARVWKPELLAASAIGTAAQAEKTAAGIRYTFRSQDHRDVVEIAYSMDPRSEDLLVTERASSAGRRVAGVRFALGPVTCNGALLLPAMAGIKAARANARYQYESAVWEWPTGWQFPFAIFQAPAGGIWIHAEDTHNRFKSLRYRDEGKGNWRIALDTANYAPFDEQDSAQSVTWHINAYAGDWTVPVSEYRSWAYTAWRMSDKQQHRPGWVDDIRLVIKHADYIRENQMSAYLDELAKHVDPRSTLLFMTDWVDPSKGMIMPYWVAGPRGERFNSEARKRGFRTMFFANYIGITPNHPRFAAFRPYVIRNAYSQDLEGWNLQHEWEAVNGIQLYYVSPAAKAWRDFEIGQFRALLRKNPADGLFLDQAFLMFNDANGLREGQSTVDGNLSYHKDLSEALPGVAIGGESINEITMQYESFCEIHPLSLHLEEDPNTKKQEWRIDGDAFDRMVPIVPHLLLPHTRPIGYLGFPETKSAFYEGWRDSLLVYRGIPTITRPSLEDLRNEDSEVRRVMRQSR
jgi:hypothetical protein